MDFRSILMIGLTIAISGFLPYTVDAINNEPCSLKNPCRSPFDYCDLFIQKCRKCYLGCEAWNPKNDYGGISCPQNERECELFTANLENWTNHGQNESEESTYSQGIYLGIGIGIVPGIGIAVVAVLLYNYFANKRKSNTTNGEANISNEVLTAVQGNGQPSAYDPAKLINGREQLVFQTRDNQHNDIGNIVPVGNGTGPRKTMNGGNGNVEGEEKILAQQELYLANK